ncbi:uncharacterized protein MYCFIDRAFT_205792 [Pseudocercospora fijiensis CIRAD86]|uniref:Uncharacterized protein n=1 Tax=Pseudocercospora fijiensis (strain CIRAD86) TaxID=383855 RepID=N1Q686_PSEFD|nr:uncharacterized protein MYCFIDRAFT_205792 [Pseudocercospora fijiensis CIRAD86]EME87775.1 hypothetical protein MYCFIDRAFT_205792 [Pseudocercospora fijiensis CIRAD86]
MSGPCSILPTIVKCIFATPPTWSELCIVRMWFYLGQASTDNVAESTRFIDQRRPEATVSTRKLEEWSIGAGWMARRGRLTKGNATLSQVSLMRPDRRRRQVRPALGYLDVVRIMGQRTTQERNKRSRNLRKYQHGCCITETGYSSRSEHI